MAHQIPIARWVLDNKKRLGLQVMQLDWPKRYLGGIHDLCTTLEIGDISVAGRGMDCDSDVALEKSMAEAIERYICKTLNIDSDGFAVSGYPNSQTHAKFEALERFYFNEHVKSDISLLVPEFESLEDRIFRSMRDSFIRRNPNFIPPCLYKMAVAPPDVGYVVGFTINNSLGAIGLAYGSDPHQVIFRAYLEGMANFARFRDYPDQFETERKNVWNCDPTFLSNAKCFDAVVESFSQTISEPYLKEVPIDISHLDILTNCPITPIKYVAERKASS